MDPRKHFANTNEKLSSVISQDARKTSPANNIDMSFKIGKIHQGNIYIKINLTYIKIPINTKIIGYIYQDNYKPSILSLFVKSKKFKTNFCKMSRKVKNIDSANEKKTLEMTYFLTSATSDQILKLLSMIHDAIIVLKNNEIVTHFSIWDIINKLNEEYKINNQHSCKVACTLERLLNIISSNPTLEPINAIYFLYCLNALKSFDYPSLLENAGLDILNNKILSTIHKLCTTLQLDARYKNELTAFFQRLNLCQRIKLYSPCLGKPADDGQVYLWNYTEWYFLRDAHFALDKHSNIYINLANEKPQSGYSKWYAPGKQNHDIFSKELSALAPLINLSFQEKINWRKKIKFTPECSQSLFAMNLHFDIENIKKMLQATHNYQFFKQACRNGYLKEKLPEEIIKIIFTLALGPTLSEELAFPLNLKMRLKASI